MAHTHNPRLVPSLYSSLPAFHVPHILSESGDVEAWKPVSYMQFLLDVELFASYWAHVLQLDGIPQRSVIGMWLSGMTYIDVLHIYGLSRAGYIPQLFSIRLPNPDVVCELLIKANARALLVDPSFERLLKRSPDDIVFIFHTSGSTSGIPKLVPCSLSWLDSAVTKSYQISKPSGRNERNQDVTVWMGSMCHIAQTFMFLGSLQHGACTLSSMIRVCGLNRVNQFATFLAQHLRASRQNPKFLALLQTLDDVLYSGLALPREEEEWALGNGIRLRNLFGSTECGAMLLSTGVSEEDAAMYLRPLEGMSPKPGSSQTNSCLLELVILAESPDCPDRSLRAADGHFHTGDLFQEAQPGYYISKGRDDDWIKSENSLRCDTKAIEDNVRATCGDVVTECVVVGNGRPSPSLFIETNSDMPHLNSTSRRYLHERITSVDMVVIVEKGSLPRTATKGNVRRRATEEAFRTLLDKIYGTEWAGSS
ncbi:acetyl-CoA synthetase-like protein [Lactarius deliciosus]|nr:acetyl-CoA synthetase-like protein [Lactarius deliciosus]